MIYASRDAGFCVPENPVYSKTCVREPPLRLILVVYVERWLSYKGTCHVILLAKLHDMYLYKTDNFFHINHYLKSVSKVALLHRFHCNEKPFVLITYAQRVFILVIGFMKTEYFHFSHSKKWLQNMLKLMG